MTDEIKQMSYEEFKKRYMSQGEEGWDFTKFKIICIKCNSDKVEFAGKIELEYGYYNSSYIIGGIIIKCHGCGNAHTIDHYYLGD